MRGNMNLCTLIVLCLVLKQTNESTCTGIMNDDHKIVTTKDTFNSNIQTSVFGVISSSVSSSIYYMYDVQSSPESTAVRKYNSDNTLAWMSIVGIRPVIKSVNVDKHDQIVCYVGNTTPTIGACHQTSNGNLISAIKM